MSGRGVSFFGSLALVLFVVGCAQPKYESAKEGAQNGNMGQGSQGESAATCSVRFKTAGYCLSWKWEEIPTDSKVGTLVFKVYRANLYDNTPVEVDFAIQPTVLLWMPAMGHGSSPTSVSRLDVGTYRASNVFFIMPGEWEIKFQVKDGSSVQDEAVVSLTI